MNFNFLNLIIFLCCLIDSFQINKETNKKKISRQVHIYNKKLELQYTRVKKII